MELIELKNKIVSHFKGNPSELNKILNEVEKDTSVFPFNEYEHLISIFLSKGHLTYNDYINIRTEYIKSNINLWLFEISAPRGFGEKFAQTYIKGLCPDIQIASKNLDKRYSGQYDLWLDGIRIEVKASRAVNSDESSLPLYMKALSRNTQHNFNMNFQQLKPQFCDVFIFLAVFRDQIVLWILNSNEVKNNRYYSIGQHRGNSGNEGQLHITQANIKEFEKYELKEKSLKDAIKKAYHRLQKSKK